MRISGLHSIDPLWVRGVRHPGKMSGKFAAGIDDLPIFSFLSECWRGLPHVEIALQLGVDVFVQLAVFNALCWL